MDVFVPNDEGTYTKKKMKGTFEKVILRLYEKVAKDDDGFYVVPFKKSVIREFDQVIKNLVDVETCFSRPAIMDLLSRIAMLSIMRNRDGLESSNVYVSCLPFDPEDSHVIPKNPTEMALWIRKM